MDLHIRLNVTARFSVTLAVDERTSLQGGHLRKVVAENIAARGIVPEDLDAIEIAEVTDDTDARPIVMGTNG